MSDDIERPYIEVRAHGMANPRYSVVVYRYLFGQYRIQITDTEQPDPYAPPGHGGIVRELDTYHPTRLGEVIGQLRAAGDPLALCRSWETVYNCEAPGRGRIRMDPQDERFPRRQEPRP